jgi:hypothetical protein
VVLEQLRKEFLKYKRLTDEQAERIGRAKHLSLSTIRRYFKRFKRNDS